MTSLTTVSQHLGSLHTYEAVLLGLLAFGPFVVLAVVVVLIRRRDLAAESEQEDQQKPESGASVRRPARRVPPAPRS